MVIRMVSILAKLSWQSLFNGFSSKLSVSRFDSLFNNTSTSRSAMKFFLALIVVSAGIENKAYDKMIYYINTRARKF